MANFYGSYIGYGSGGGVAVPNYFGAEYQFCHGGQQAGPTGYNTIDRLSYTSEATADDWHDLAVTMFYTTGQSSGTHGFCAGGHAQTTTINKYQQLAQVLGADHGDLNTGSGPCTGSSDMTNQNGYTHGGSNSGGHTKIDKFAFLSNTTASTVGDITVARNHGGSCSSVTHGYCHGGHSGAVQNVIDRFSFASEGTAEDWGDLTIGRGTMQGSSSDDYGFYAGGYQEPGSGYQSRIDKYPFASNAGGADWGELTSTVQGCAGSSATGYGFTCGGQPPATITRVERFSHDSDAGASTWGGLSQARVYPECSQY